MNWLPWDLALLLVPKKITNIFFMIINNVICIYIFSLELNQMYLTNRNMEIDGFSFICITRFMKNLTVISW